MVNAGVHGCMQTDTWTHARTYRSWPRLGKSPVIPSPPRKRQGTDGNGQAVCALRFFRREHTASDHVVYLFYFINNDQIIMVLFVIAEAPGSELSLHHSHPSS